MEYEPLNVPLGTSGKAALEVAREAAKLAGKLARERFEGEKGIRFKRPGDVVTEVDIEAEALIFGLIREEFPDHTLVGEESASDVRADEGYAWIVDPVDGTRNGRTRPRYQGRPPNGAGPSGPRHERHRAGRRGVSGGLRQHGPRSRLLLVPLAPHAAAGPVS